MKTSRSNSFTVDAQLNVQQVGLNSTSEQSFTVPGVVYDNNYSIWFDSMDAGVSWTPARGTASDTLTVRFINTTAGNITPGILTAHIVGL